MYVGTSGTYIYFVYTNIAHPTSVFIEEYNYLN